MKPESLYHTGIVVDDFEAALAWFTEVAGYRWCEELALDQTVWTPGGDRTVPIRFAYSMSEPRLEILQAVPGTVWMPANSGIHHLGYWSDDVDADLDVLGGAGYEAEVKAPTAKGSSLWAYCRADGRPRVELVSRSLEPMMAEWFATGRSPLG
ncbi:MAG TPA: VOC family protein [Acidimicrobiales bacterium]|nr:VOC family protein [Acidimicrobiales bacterium]